MLVALRIHAHSGDDVVRGHDDAVHIDRHQFDLGKAAVRQFSQCLGTLLDKGTRHGVFGDAQHISAAMYHTSIFARAHIAHQDVGDARRELAVVSQRGIGWHSHFAGTVAQARPLDA